VVQNGRRFLEAAATIQRMLFPATKNLVIVYYGIGHINRFNEQNKEEPRRHMKQASIRAGYL
jgi:hypothetical protein